MRQCKNSTQHVVQYHVGLYEDGFYLALDQIRAMPKISEKIMDKFDISWELFF